MKNRKKANIILTILMLVFMLLTVLKHYYGEPFFIKMFIFIVEAAMVGSIADWFAVTALFERPLGIPIKPIIPSNKEKILNNLSAIVNNNLLDMNYIQNIIENMQVSETIIGFVENKTTMKSAKNWLLSYVLNSLSSYRNDKTKYTKFINYIKGKSKDINFTKTKVLKLSDKYIQNRFTKVAYTNMIDKLIVFLSKDESYNKLHKFLSSQINEQSGKKFKFIGGIKKIVNTDNLAKAIHSESINFLNDLKVSDKKYNYIKKIITMYSNEHLEEVDLNKILNNFIDNFAIEKRIDTVLTLLETLLIAISDDSKDTSNVPLAYDDNLKSVVAIITDLTEDLWKQIKNDAGTLSWIDSVVKGLIIEIIEKNRTEFGGFVEERIKGFTDGQLESLIEDSAGEPLQWIRINGAMIGAMLGFALFSFINFVYEPFILPLANKLIGLV
ncbi:MAG: DUF445 family protein [Clostridium sp.]|uniref:DUF445 family protein n=1 Tax=Clostridium sp. TaxID=1506 RepID=UPI003D6C8F9C